MGKQCRDHRGKIGAPREHNLHSVGGWVTPLKNMNVTWDDENPNIWENKIDVPNHQPVLHLKVSSSENGGTPSWMVDGKWENPKNKDDDWGSPHFRKPPYELGVKGLGGGCVLW